MRDRSRRANARRADALAAAVKAGTSPARLVVTGGAVVCLALFGWLSLRYFDGSGAAAAFTRLFRDPLALCGMTAAYFGSFVLKACAWRLYANREKADKLAVYVYPLLVSLLVNHLLPIKAGDLARTAMLMRSTGLKWDEALHTVAVMRVLDLAALVTLGGAGLAAAGFGLQSRQPGAIPFSAAAAIGVAAFALLHRLKGSGRLAALRERLKRHGEMLRSALLTPRGAAVLLLVSGSWVLEGAVAFGTAGAITGGKDPLGFAEAVWANSMTVAGQVFHLTPGGIGTYETTMTAALTMVGFAGSEAYRIALVSHAYKFAFSYAFGAAACIIGAVSVAELRGWLSKKSDSGQGEGETT